MLLELGDPVGQLVHLDGARSPLYEPDKVTALRWRDVPLRHVPRNRRRCAYEIRGLLDFPSDRAPPFRPGSDRAAPRPF
jgi:hypothetical protein